MPTAAKVALHIVVLALALVAAVQGQSMTGLHVQGNKILNQAGQQIQLRVCYSLALTFAIVFQATNHQHKKLTILLPGSGSIR